jgi:VanZ family protein
MSIVSETDGLRKELKEASGVRGPWLAASAAWTALILFSSTSLASEYCEHAFTWIVGSTVGKHFTSAKAYDWLHFLAEKSLHLTLFFVLGVLLWHAFTAPRRRRLVQVVLAGFVFGSASELLQAAFPDRDPAIRDVLINVVGAFLGAVACARRASTDRL